MKKLHFEYRMDIQYSSPADNCDFTMKCFPCTDARQKPEKIQTRIVPDCTWSMGRDGFGNTAVSGKVNRKHDSFSLLVSGNVMIKQVLFEEEAGSRQSEMFQDSYGLNRSGKKLKQYFEDLSPEKYGNPYEKALMMMHRLHSDFPVLRDSAGPDRTAEEAWNRGSGSCRDCAHIFIALCHMAGIPARYAAGMFIGEGTAHAWAEILYHGEWIGMDPVNNVLVTDSHIKTGHGRDSADCQNNCRAMQGGGKQTQRISVSVAEAVEQDAGENQENEMDYDDDQVKNRKGVFDRLFHFLKK